MTGTDLDVAVAEARARYAEVRPISAGWSDRAAKVVPGDLLGNCTAGLLGRSPAPVSLLPLPRSRLLRGPTGARNGRP